MTSSLSGANGYTYIRDCAKAVHSLVEQFHYSHRAVRNTSFAAGFLQNGELVAGICFFSPATRWSEPVLELIRLVRKPDVKVPLTQLISLASKDLKQAGYDLLISNADSTAGHHGGVYQAASWNFGGKRKPAQDGVIINGVFKPGRSCNEVWKTRSVSKLREILGPSTEILPHYDTGKYFYWRALSKSGEAKAERLGLLRLPYPKPDTTSIQPT